MADSPTTEVTRMSETTSTAAETSGEVAFGLDPNLASALAAFFGGSLIVPGVIYAMSEDEYTRFYAMQGLLLGVVTLVTSFVFIGTLLLLVHFFMAYKAYQGERWELPVLGGIAADQV